MEKDYLPHARTVQSPCCPRLDGLPLPWSARWRTKGKRNGMFKHGLYMKEAVQERRLLPELLRQSILGDFVRSRSRRSLEHRIDDLMPE